MPELPEVQHFKEYIDSTALHKRIESVDVHSTKVLRDISGKDFSNKLEGRTFQSTYRRGKFLFLQLDNDHHLQLHFGMTGYPVYYKDDSDREKYERITFHFANGYQLGYVCKRMLGKVRYVKDLENYLKEKELGPDALDLSKKEFLSLMETKKGALKSFLMNQKYLAGIGNEFADEICFRAKVHPAKAVDKLSEDQKKEVYDAMKYILQTAVDKHGEFDQYPDSWLIKHREEGAEGPKGCGKVRKTTISGRSTYFCEELQGTQSNP